MRINIKVRRGPGPLTTLDLDPSATMADLKVALEKTTGWRVCMQRARFNRMITHDAVTLEQYGMKDDDMVVMEVRTDSTGFLAELEENFQKLTPQEALDIYHAGLRAQRN